MVYFHKPNLEKGNSLGNKEFLVFHTEGDRKCSSSLERITTNNQHALLAPQTPGPMNGMVTTLQHVQNS